MRRINRWGFGSVVLLLVACQATAPADDELGRDGNSGAREEIKGGKTTSAFAAVGALYDGTQICTGALIGPRKVLTATHCVLKFDVSKLDFWLGPKVDDSAKSIPVESMTPHPLFEQKYNLHDVAFVTLTKDAPVAPMKLLGSMDKSWVGEELVFVGYGATAPNVQDGGIKRSVNMKITEVFDLQFRFNTPGASTCYGDSGGPALAKLNGSYVIAGVHSGVVDPTCNGMGIEARVDIDKEFLETGNVGSGTGGSGSSSGSGGGGGTAGSGGSSPTNIDSCQGETYEGRCDGETAIWCANGSVQTQNCASDGRECGFSPVDSYFGCVEKTDNCQGETYEGRCEGNTLIWCENDQVSSLACETCGYDSASGFHDCL